jgi:hypothetical protein
MHPAVDATTRTPGPSTVDPVVNEWRNPMSPVASAVRTSVSGICAPSFTRISNGLAASMANTPGPLQAAQSAARRGMPPLKITDAAPWNAVDHYASNRCPRSQPHDVRA